VMIASHDFKSFHGLFGAFALYCLAGCGIDQGGYSDPQPATAAQTFVMSGPIATNGGLTVNDTTLEAGTASVVVNGNPATEADLRAGQVIRVIAQQDGATTTALFIEFRKNLSGNIESIDSAAGSLTALGQKIVTAAVTRFDIPGVTRLADLQVGDRIMVSGIPTPTGEIFATYIGPDDAAAPFEVTAVIAAADQPGLSFDLGSLTVDFSQANLLDVAAGMPQSGSIVRVIGSSLASDVLVATRVREVAHLPGAFGATATQISDGELAVVGAAPANAERTANFVGFVTATSLPDAIAVDDVDVQLDAGTVVVAGRIRDLQPGQRVQVEGRILEVGRVLASVITIL
jgi:hypothetical protein